jgi:hypothetical protein
VKKEEPGMLEKILGDLGKFFEGFLVWTLEGGVPPFGNKGKWWSARLPKRSKFKRTKVRNEKIKKMK